MKNIGVSTALLCTLIAVPVFADTQFAVGQRVQVANGPLNARTDARIDAASFGSQKKGALGVLHQGPRSEGGIDWWFVDYDSGVDGWSASKFLTTDIKTTSASQAAAAAAGARDSQIDALYQLVQNLQRIVEQMTLTHQH